MGKKSRSSGKKEKKRFDHFIMMLEAYFINVNARSRLYEMRRRNPNNRLQLNKKKKE